MKTSPPQKWSLSQKRRYSHIQLGDENFTPIKMESFSEEKVFTSF
jgi:hypothetical protein